MASIPTISRRAVLVGLPLVVAGCGMSPEGFDVFPGGGFGTYGVLDDGGITIPSLDLRTIDRTLLPPIDRHRLGQLVAWRGPQKRGSIVVNIPERHLYLVLDNGRALRYSVGVG